MSFKRFDVEDIVISADSITSPAWSNNVTTLSNFYTSADQIARNSGKYYYNIYQVDPSDSTAAIQFSISYGDSKGSGSVAFNPSVLNNSPSSVIYKQMRTLVNGTEEVDLSFNGTTPETIFVISVERSRYKEKLFPGSLSLTLTSGSTTRTFTDDSNYAATIVYGDSGREYNIISGSAGVKNSSIQTDGYTLNSGSYGKFLPDVGLIILNGKALESSTESGGMEWVFPRSSNIDDGLMGGFKNTITSFTLRAEETVSSNYVFVRARNSEFNYSTNPSNITGSGELRHDVMIDTPQSYITGIGLYNDNNDLLAVAKLSRPLIKDFTKEALIRIKLDY